MGGERHLESWVSCPRTQHNVPGQGSNPDPEPDSRKPRKLSGPVKPLQNLEPCDYRAVLFTILKMKGSSLHTRSFRRIHVSVLRYRWSKNGFTGPKTFRGFRETAPRTARSGNERTNHEATASTLVRGWPMGTEWSFFFLSTGHKSRFRETIELFTPVSS